MTRDEAEQLAEARGQVAVLVNWCGRLSWLMSDLQSSTVEDLAQNASTGNWEQWTAGKLGAFDASGQPLVELDGATYDWPKTPQPIEFRPMAWHVCTVSGMGRLSVRSQHTSQDKAQQVAERLSSKPHYLSARVRWLPVGSRGSEIKESP